MHVVLEAALIAPNAVGATDSLVGVLIGSAKGVLIQVNILVTVSLRDPLLLGHHELLVGGRRGSTSQMMLLDCDLVLASVDGWISIPKPWFSQNGIVLAQCKYIKLLACGLVDLNCHLNVLSLASAFGNHAISQFDRRVSGPLWINLDPVFLNKLCVQIVSRGSRVN